MAEDKIKKAFLWLRKKFEITDQTTLPGKVLGEVQPTIDTLGWDLASDPNNLEHVTVSAAGPGSSVTLPAVPADQVFLYIAADVFHTDALASHLINIVLLHADRGFATRLVPDVLAIDGQRNAIQRPFLVPAVSTIRGVSQDTFPGGSAMTVSASFIRIRVPGDYIPGSPWG